MIDWARHRWATAKTWHKIVLAASMLVLVTGADCGDGGVESDRPPGAPRGGEHTVVITAHATDQNQRDIPFHVTVIVRGPDGTEAYDADQERQFRTTVNYSSGVRLTIEVEVTLTQPNKFDGRLACTIYDGPNNESPARNAVMPKGRTVNCQLRTIR